MIAIGLTGGIGAGKSTVSKLLAERGAVILDLDRFSRAALALDGAGYADTVARFGAGIVAPGGEVDRPALAAIVFADTAARRDLEAIVHPIVDAAVLEGLSREAQPGRVVIVDSPLLVETDGRRRYGLDGVLVVDAPEEVAIARLMTDRAMSEDDARRRIAAQSDRLTRLRAADFIILNEGTLAELAAMVDNAWRWAERLLSERGEALSSSN